ncbi:MAG: hypothetical protein LBG81_03780 [Coriobacteriaceae bacterium]|jgi:hypothetical protein|nr:hypothetical protein [Coriobacteriaceae bacterium]
MAFKELSKRELLRMDEKQRQNYEEQLARFRARCAFFERAEAQAKIAIPPVKPQLTPVTVLEGIDVRPFVKPEYTFTQTCPVVVPDLPNLPAITGEQRNPVLPVPPQKPTIKAMHIKGLEKRKPALPVVVKPVAPAMRRETFRPTIPHLPVPLKPKPVKKAFVWKEQAPPQLPVVAKPSFEIDLPLKPASIDLSHVQKLLPKPPIPKPVMRQFKPPARTSPDLPVVAVRHDTFKDYRKPEPVTLDLPKVAKPRIKIPPFKGIPTVLPNLPKPPRPSLKALAYSKPAATALSLPKATLPKSVEWVSRLSEKMPQAARPTLPRVVLPGLKTREFTKVERERPQLPIMTPLVVPDAYEKLKDLLSPEVRASMAARANSTGNMAAEDAFGKAPITTQASGSMTMTEETHGKASPTEDVARFGQTATDGTAL